MRVKAVVGYDGTGYAGFQRQLNAPTIQAEIEDVLNELTGEGQRVVASGRTDAGVHAEGQVVAFDTVWKHQLESLHRGMNALLPEQIVVRELAQVSDTFHPRYDALRRHYRYTLYHAVIRNPLLNRYSLHVSRELDMEAMQSAAQSLVGRYDFSAFGSPPQGNNAVREVFRADWIQNGHLWTFDIEANAFLRRMVRLLVGTLIQVGYGKVSPEEFKMILSKADRDLAGPAAPAHGLCLIKVVYTEASFKSQAHICV